MWSLSHMALQLHIRDFPLLPFLRYNTQWSDLCLSECLFSKGMKTISNSNCLLDSITSQDWRQLARARVYSLIWAVRRFAVSRWRSSEFSVSIITSATPQIEAWLADSGFSGLFSLKIYMRYVEIIVKGEVMQSFFPRFPQIVVLLLLLHVLRTALRGVQMMP